MRHSLSLLLLLLPLTPTALLSSSIPLTKIKTLTLRAGKHTSARRTSPIPQLKCIGGNAKGLYKVDAMRCTNVGGDYDGADVQWTCTASLPTEFKLGSTEVLCEGYSSPEDTRVLKGSCGVEYTLMLTQRGEEKYASRSGRSILLPILMLLGVVLALAMILRLRRDSRNPRPRPPRGGFGWGGGGPDDGNDPPPPYSSPYSFSPPKGATNPPSSFWTNAAGSAAGSFMGTAMANRMTGANRQANQGGSSWWGRSRRNSSTTSGPSRSSSTSQSTTYTSTGFGGTTRR